MLTTLLLIIIGIILGTITGLIPGIHINMISTFILTSYLTLSKYLPDKDLITIIVSMSVTHTFLDFIPTTFLGAPSSDTALSALPSHQYLINGKGYEAVKISIIGSIMGLISISLITPLIIFSIPAIYNFLKEHISIILIISSLFLILKDKKSRIKSTIIFIASGILGAVVLNSYAAKQPLLPLFTGLFGISSLIISIQTKTKIPEQIITEPKISTKESSITILQAILSSTLTGFLPGLGSSQAAIISTSTSTKEIEPKYYILLIGAINTIVMIISFLALNTIDKSRNGVGIAIQGILQNLSIPFLIYIISVSLIAGSIASFAGIKITKLFANKFQKINYSKLCKTIIIFLIIITILISGSAGLLILFTATALGIITQLINVPRHHLMGCLIFPMIMFFIL